MTAYEEFRPDWVSAPGDTIADILQERSLPVREFAQLIGQSVEATTDLLQGRTAITLAMARELVRVLGASVVFWMARDFQYRQDSARLNEAHQDWVRQLPLSDMIKFGWLTPAATDGPQLTVSARMDNTASGERVSGGHCQL
jgi:HTH-type transcriptional regulator / antitoxin HigA